MIESDAPRSAIIDAVAELFFFCVRAAKKSAKSKVGAAFFAQSLHAVSSMTGIHLVMVRWARRRGGKTHKH